MKKPTKPLYILTECAVFVALSIVLAWIKIPMGASGGSIDFVMVPLFIIARRHGALYGVGSCLVAGFLKCVLGGGLGWGLPSVLLDYVLAYGACGLAGIFHKNDKLHEVCVFFGCFARFFIHFLSGIFLYAITVPTEIESIGKTFVNPYTYSLVYNAIYMLPNTVLALVVMCILVRLPQTKKLF